MNCEQQALEAGLDAAEIQRIRNDIKEGLSSKDAIHRAKLRTEDIYNNHPASMKQAKEIQDEINKSTINPFKRIAYALIPEHGKGNTFNNVETTKKSIMESVLHTHNKTLNNLRNKLFGNRYSKDLLDRMARQMFDKRTDKDATAAFKEFNEINDAMYSFYTRSGGKDKKQEFAIQNDTDRILGTSVDQFVRDTLPFVKNSESDLRALYKKGLEGGDIEDTILSFNDADSFLQYNAHYGTNLWNSFINRLEKQATDTAFNKILGPNSKSTLSKLMKDNRLNAAERDRINSLVDALTGQTNRVMGSGANLSKYAKGSRSLTAATMLGGATLSAVADLATVLVTAKFNNLPAIKTMLQGLKGVFLQKDNQETLARLGFITDDLLDGLRSTSRFDPNAAGTDMLSQTTDKVLRVSGLIAWTNGLKNSWKLSHLGNMAEQVTKYKTIPKKMKEQMKTYGITQKDWNTMREIHQGEFLDVTKLPDDLNFKMRKYITEESQYAVLEPGASNQAYMALGTHAGTVKGEIVRGGTQFKSFLVAGVLTHLSRILKLDTAKSQAEYGLSMLVAGTTIGMLVVALKDIKNGIDPTSRDYSDPKNMVEPVKVAFDMIGPFSGLLAGDEFGKSKLDILSVASAPSISILSKPYTVVKNFIENDYEEAIGKNMREISKLVPGRNLAPTMWLTDGIFRNMAVMVHPEIQHTFDKVDAAKRARDSKSGLEDIEFF